MTDARRRDWEGVATKVGRICEGVYSILKGHVDGAYAPKPFKPSNMVTACTALELADAARFPRTVRITLPRVILAVYEFRNNRAVHAGADVQPNGMDGEYLARSVQWIVAELVRVFSSLAVEDAQAVVEVVSERSVPLLWIRDDIIRILNPKLSMQDKALVLLYHEAHEVPIRRLAQLLEYGDVADFEWYVIRPLHADAFVHRFPPAPWWKAAFSPVKQPARVLILPPGIERVERGLTSGKWG